MRRGWTVAAAVVVATACGDRRPVGPPATAAKSATTAPSVAASLVRLARAGGLARAYDGATLDQLPWQTADKVPAIALVAGADLDQRNVYVVDTRHSLVSVELGSRRLRVIAPNVLEAAVGPDGSIYAVDTTRSVQVVARRGVTRFHTKLPRASRSLAGSPTGSLVAVLAGAPELVTLTEAGPLSTTPIAAGATASTMYGDVVAVAADSGVYVYESAGHRPAQFWPLEGHVRAVVFSPSGHRLYAGRESGGITVIDRFSGNTVEEIALPGSVAELRVGQVGRWLLVRPVGRDSTWVVDLGISKMIGAVATSWDADLPAVTAPSTVTVRHAGDVVAVKVTAGRITETGRVRGGADDFWLPIAWAPESQPTITADSIVATRDTTRKSKVRDSAKAGAPASTAATTTASSPDAAPLPGQAIYLQVSSSRNPEWATSLVERLKDAHLPARTLAPATPDDPYRVVLGPYASRDEADAASRTIGMPSFVLTGPADPPAHSPSVRELSTLFSSGGMKLIRLELSGFKSFADTVTLTFEHGVTAIVGPNGCGKSNVSDAVRWVLGEQSARLLRGGKMEDVIFQGSQQRRPVNVTEVSLVLDNSDGDLPIAYREVVITRRLSRSGQSDYLLNKAIVRLRDIQDLLRGTGLGGDAGVVIEADMIKQLLSDRADERRALFEEASGIGLYRDRKQSSERRLEETSLDLQRVEDLINEKQSQLRSLARQRGKAERHVKLMEEKFGVSLTLARRHLERLASENDGRETRAAELVRLLPVARAALADAEAARESAAAARSTQEAERTALVVKLGELKVEIGRLDGDLALATERLGNSAERRRRASEERGQMMARAEQAITDLAAAEQERAEAEAAHAQVRAASTGKVEEEEKLRALVTERRDAVRTLEAEAQQAAQAHQRLEGERASLEQDLQVQRERASRATEQRERVRSELADAERRRDQLVERAGFLAYEARTGKDALEQSVLAVTAAREVEARERGVRRDAEQALAALAARRGALEALERDRVGLAPAAAALLAARQQFGDAVLGPLSDFVSVSSADAELAERLLGEWMHAVLVRDEAAVEEIRRWHAQQKPGALVLLPASPGPSFVGVSPYDARLKVDGAAEGWVRAALAGSEVLDGEGRVLRRASGAIFLSGEAPASGPLRRRAELNSLTEAVAAAEATVAAAEAALAMAVAGLTEAEQRRTAAAATADAAARAEREGIAARDQAVRTVANMARELENAEREFTRIGERVTHDETRLAAVAESIARFVEERTARTALLGAAHSSLHDAETQTEAARDARARAQVDEAHAAGRLRTARERVERATSIRDEATRSATALGEELTRLDGESTGLAEQQGAWQATRAERAAALAALEAEVALGQQALAAAIAALTSAEAMLHGARDEAASLADESHRLDLERAEAQSLRTRIVERIEQEWRRPIADLLAEFTPLDIDLETLESEAARIGQQLEQIGPVNPLAVEEHAEEAKKVEFLIAQRDDLLAARQSLLQAIREIDGTAKNLFLETFEAIRTNFHRVFQRMFDGGECELRLADPENPLDCEIEILAAPRGKRIQHVRLLSAGEKTLVATSLLFGLYLTKPSPFCLMDEVDAPLDDANVGRFVRLLEEFKTGSQFLVITHNPRTMQAADAVYGVTMQEPGISTIVGVRLGEAAV